jgi:hypothetical protein
VIILSRKLKTSWKKLRKSYTLDLKISTILVIAIIIASMVFIIRSQPQFVYVPYSEGYTGPTNTIPTTTTTTTTPVTTDTTTTVTYGTPYTEWVLIFGVENLLPGIYSFTITFTTSFESKVVNPFTSITSDHAYFIYSGVTPETETIVCTDNGPTQIYGGGSLTFPVGWNPGTKVWFNFYETGSDILVMKCSVEWMLVYTYP